MPWWINNTYNDKVNTKSCYAINRLIVNKYINTYSMRQNHVCIMIKTIDNTLYKVIKTRDYKPFAFQNEHSGFNIRKYLQVKVGTNSPSVSCQNRFLLTLEEALLCQFATSCRSNFVFVASGTLIIKLFEMTLRSRIAYLIFKFNLCTDGDLKVGWADFSIIS